MRFEWDEAKARANLAKHGVSFELASRVWDDPLIDVRFDSLVGGEERWVALGIVRTTTLLVVIHTYPAAHDETVVRIVSARRATSHERRNYEHETL
jgi:uncharacterized DUF497 family protein